MPDAPVVNLSAGGEGSVSFRSPDGNLEVPLSGMVYGQFSGQLPTLGDEFDLTINTKLMGGGDTYQGDEATLYGGHLDRWVVYRSRLNLFAPYLGLTKFNVEGKFNTPGIKLYAGISPQEDYVYPYNFNAVTFEDGTAANTLFYNILDNTSGANIYTTTIGFLFGAEWTPPFAEGLRIVGQTGPDGGLIPAAPWVSTGQVGYSKEYSLGPDKGSTTVALYGTILNPSQDEDETLFPKKGLGGFFSQRLGLFQVGAGYAFNVQETAGETGNDLTRVNGFNAAMTFWVPGDRLIVTGAYTYLKVDDEAEHSLEPINLVFRLTKGLVIRGGYMITGPESRYYRDGPVNETQHLVYTGIGFGHGATFE